MKILSCVIANRNYKEWEMEYYHVYNNQRILHLWACITENSENKMWLCCDVLREPSWSVLRCCTEEICLISSPSEETKE